MVVPLSDQTLTALLFGKLPAHGDFVSRGLEPAARESLDLWLTRSLADARDARGDAFDDLYEKAPPWRFAWADGAGWTAGAMALSVDGVGRRYPILIAASGLAGERIEHAAAALEDLLYAAFEGGWDADRLHAAAGALTPEPMTAWEGGEGWWTLGTEHFNEAYLSGARPAGLIDAMLARGEPAGQDRAEGPDDG